ncbi:hypothetical protein J6590_076818 [Homalodisca vitripennis]|nr:hypothetical protein J6590_076818 [Homalodisca vitripennis]
METKLSLFLAANSQAECRRALIRPSLSRLPHLPPPRGLPTFAAETGLCYLSILRIGPLLLPSAQ